MTRSQLERYTLSSIDGIDLPADLPVELARPRFNIAHEHDAPVALRHDDTRTVVAMRWGMLAPWQGHGGKRPPPIYTTTPAAFEATPLLRNAFRAQRCLVLADGCFVWARTGKKSTPYWLHATAPIAFAALWNVHRDDGRQRFAILVAPAPRSLSPITPVVPVLADDRWLDSPDDARAVLAAAPTPLRARAVSAWVNDEAHDDPRCIAPLGNPAQGELF